MTQTTNIGRTAELAAVEHLRKLGYEVLERNWRTRWCEIDIVARKNETIYFVEVKYRKNHQQGGGLAFVTDKKVKQMRFAAEFWAAANYFDGDWELSAVEVSGLDFAVTDFVESLT